MMLGQTRDLDVNVARVELGSIGNQNGVLDTTGEAHQGASSSTNSCPSSMERVPFVDNPLILKFKDISR